ncbi:MAG: acyltransferase family protein [Myxococcales bacterium]|nr:acyltransferase family protein [Myxococcales bacterium]
MPEDAERRHALDAVRGLAITLVALVHFGTPHAPATDAASSLFFALLDSGWVGVDLFFVLSGYLITRKPTRAGSSSSPSAGSTRWPPGGCSPRPNGGGEASKRSRARCACAPSWAARPSRSLSSSTDD